jgi:hypothetical protein
VAEALLAQELEEQVAQKVLIQYSAPSPLQVVDMVAGIHCKAVPVVVVVVLVKIQT